jgi:flagellar hook-basal body complex protein FliE
MQALTGQASLTNIVTATSNAEMVLQTVVSIRDRVVNALQEILRMPI